MKMKNVLLSLSLAGLCFSQAPAQAFPQSPTQPPAAKHIGDGVKSIGDTNRFTPESPDTRPAVFRPTGSNAQSVRPVNGLDMQLLAPTACSTQCDTGREGHFASRKSLFSDLGCGDGKKWFSAESLLWFGQNQNLPGLVTTSESGVFPTLGSAGVTSAVGGPDGLDTGLLPGFRIAGGTYLDDCQKIGFGGRAYGIFSNAEEFAMASDGTQSIGIPFFNANVNVAAEDAYLVAFTNGSAQPVSAGDVATRSDLDMIGAEASFHILLGRSSDHRIDLLAGYTYNNLRSSVSVDSNSTNLFTGDLIPDGTEFQTHDTFETKNVFNGAHLGILSSVIRSKLTLTTLAKVSFGNMRQTMDIRGFTNTSFGGVTQNQAGGILTQPSNIGTSSQDVFGFIPELGLKLGYNVRENVQLTVGYTFMMWSGVGLAGDQIDRTVDLSQGVLRPTHTMTDGAFWMQGIDLGLNYNF